jgi:hypothetical protein
MATRYWVGGAGNWSSTTKWSASSGGASGASVPTSADDVVFDANSGGKFVATVDTPQTCASLAITPAAGAGVFTIALTATLTVIGNFTTTGTAGNNRILIRGNTYGIATNFICNGTYSISDCDFRDIYFIGVNAPLTGTRLGNLGGLRGITTSAPKTVYWTLAAGGNWSATAWGASSGAAASTDSHPLAQDTAIIENTGLNTLATITLDAAISYFGTLDMSSRSNGFTLAGTTAYTIYGNLTASSALTRTYTGVITFAGREKTQVFNPAGINFNQNIVVDVFGGTVELGSALTLLNATSDSLIVTNGTFDTKNYAMTLAVISSNNVNYRTIRLGSSAITLTSTNSTFNINTSGLTFDAGTSTITSTAAGGSGSATWTWSLPLYNFIITPGNLNITLNGNSTYNNFTLTLGSTAQTFVFGSINTFNNLTINPVTADVNYTISFGANQNITGTLSVPGTNPLRRTVLISNSTGVERFLNVATLSTTDTDFRDIVISGAAAGTTTSRCGDLGGNSGVTFGSRNCYWNLSGDQNWTANAWALSSGGTPNANAFPTASDIAIFDNTGSVGNVTMTSTYPIGSVDFSARTTAMNFTTSTNSPSIYGDWKWGAGVTSLAATGSLTFVKRGLQTFTSSNVITRSPVVISKLWSNVPHLLKIADDIILDSNKVLTLTSGMFEAGGSNVRVGGFSSTNTNTRTLDMGNAIWELTGVGTVWDLGTVTNLLFLKNKGNIYLSNISTSARTFNGGGLSYNKLILGGETGNSTTTITGNNQFIEITSNKNSPHTIALGTTAQTFGKWNISGTAANSVFLTGSGTGHIIAGESTSNVDYLSMGSIGFSATSQGEFFAGANSTGTAGAPVYRIARPSSNNRFWVSGTGNWSDTGRWSNVSGGANGFSVPYSIDNVTFDSSSNPTDYTVTFNTAARVKTLTVGRPASGNVTFAGSSNFIAHGNVMLSATNFINSFTGAIVLSGSSGPYYFTSNGAGIGSTVYVDGVGSDWYLNSSISTGSGLVITNGSFNFTTYNYTMNNAYAYGGLFFSNNSNDRTINFANSTVSFLSLYPCTYFTNNLNLTTIPGNSTISLNNTGWGYGGFTTGFYLGSYQSQNFNRLYYNSGGGTDGSALINGANIIFNTLEFVQPDRNLSITYPSNVTVTSNLLITPPNSWINIISQNHYLNTVWGGNLILANGVGYSYFHIRSNNSILGNIVCSAPASSPGYASLILYGNVEVKGNTIITGANSYDRWRLTSDRRGVRRTLTSNSIGWLDVDVFNINLSGNAFNSTGSRIGDGKNNFGINFPAPKTVYWNYNANRVWRDINWAATPGGAAAAANYPLIQDTANITNSSPGANAIITFDTETLIGNLDTSGRTTPLFIQTQAAAWASTHTGFANIYGNISLGSGMNFIRNDYPHFIVGNSVQTISGNANAFQTTLVIDGYPNSNVELVLLSNTRVEGPNVNLVSGNINLNGFNLSATTFSTNFNNPRVLKFGSNNTGKLTLSGNLDANFTSNLRVEGSGEISFTSANAKIFHAGSYNFSNIRINQSGLYPVTPGGNLTIFGSNISLGGIKSDQVKSGFGLANVNLYANVITFPNMWEGTGIWGANLFVTGSSTPVNIIFTGNGKATVPAIDNLILSNMRVFPLSNVWYGGKNSTNYGVLGWEFDNGYSIPAGNIGTAQGSFVYFLR